MPNRLFYLTAPSRSGSSLLTTLLNSLKDVLVVNEPPDSYRIDSRDAIENVYGSILTDLEKGYLTQRLNKTGQEVTDTYPDENISWQKVVFDDYSKRTLVGLKKSFPSLRNKDYHQKFIKNWEPFVKWFTKTKRGKIVTIIRNPIYTIFSWKTTFDALKDKTKKQCLAWNRIAKAIYDTRTATYIAKYEDLVSDTNSELKKICDYLETDLIFRGNPPKIHGKYNSLDYYTKERKLPNKETAEDIRIIFSECNDLARKFDYNLESDMKTILKSSFFQT